MKYIELIFHKIFTALHFGNNYRLHRKLNFLKKKNLNNQTRVSEKPILV